MLNIGDNAPDFEIPAGEARIESLSAVLSRGPVVLYFYPADFTPVCTRQACMFRDTYRDLADAGLIVIGVSPQDTETHDKFKEQYKLPFGLVPDTDRRVTRAYRATWPLGIGIRRVTYLIRQDAVIADRVAAELDLDDHEDFVARAIEAAKAGKLSGGRPQSR